MTSDLGGALRTVQKTTSVVSMLLLVGLASGATVATLLAAAGLMPWIEAPLAFGGEPVAAAGAILQVGLTAFLLALCGILPSAIRVMRLEATHRDFSLRMEDITRAYYIAHDTDRQGVFNLSREYDAVRERLEFLRKHPDLDDLDHSVLEVAAQMGHEARELAKIYSDDRVKRARETLEIRREEAQKFSDRIAFAHQMTDELRRVKDEVEMDEAVVRSRLSRLQNDVAELTMLLDDSVTTKVPVRRRPKLDVVPGE